MPIHGLVVALKSEAIGPSVEKRIEEAGPFILGDRFGSYLVLAMECDSEDQAQTWHEWLTQLDGVAKVDLAFSSCAHSDVPEIKETA